MNLPALIRRAQLLSIFTIVYNLAEGLVSIAFGVKEGSVALAGFGADSFIEVASAVLVLWRFRGEAGLGGKLSLERERRATLGVALLFIALAALTVVASLLRLYSGTPPETTVPGVVISLVSLSFMFALWRAKQRVGEALGSPVVLADARCSLACIRLSFVLLAGSLVYWLVPSFHWADAIAALVIAWFIGAEGRELWQNARSDSFTGGACCGGGCEPSRVQS